MEYSYLSQEEQSTGLRNRIHELEQQHFANELYADECRAIGQDTTQFEAANAALKARIDVIKKKLAEYEDGSTAVSE